jgi:hypothetical protein
MATADLDIDEALHVGFGVLERRIPGDQLRRLEGYAVEIFRAFGMDLCTMMRGVRGASAQTRTIFWRGEYADNAALRTEFFTACGLQR